MGTLFRSQEMQLVQLFVQDEAAHDTVDELGKLGLIQFRDLNPEVSAFQRRFVKEVKKCDEMERKLRFFEETLQKEQREIEEEKTKGREEMALLRIDDLAAPTTLESPEVKKQKLEDLETQLDEFEKDLVQINQNQETLERNFKELVELKHVLHKDSSFFAEASEASELLPSDHDTRSPLLGETYSASKSVKLGYVTGVILREKFTSFERVLWRVLRGNLFMKHAEIDEKIKDPQSGELVEKNVFIIFYQGERSQQKIKKVCESYNANIYPCPDNNQQRKELLSQINNQLEELETVLNRTRKHKRSMLLDIGRNLQTWKERVTKEKAIYHTMNLFNSDEGRKCFIAEGWCPTNATSVIVAAMRQATETSGALVPSILNVIPSKEEPPTYFQTNKFTRSFQSIVDAYGIAHYQEVNPGVFTIITFPFLFAVMFGDLGHGLLLTLFALYLVLNEKKLGAQQLNELIKTCYDGRYMLLLMGLFSMYTGFLYNEVFSIPMDLFGSNWRFPDANATVAERIDPDRVYEIGVDPAWKGSVNALAFYNSLKMKMSVLLGVTQMVLGIVLSLLNAIHFKKTVNIVGEFIPQMIFMNGLFGYMCFLIIYKWAQPWTHQSPPFLLNVMISMFLSPISVSEEDKVYNGQLYVQLTLLVLCLISIPWMLLLKPYVLKKRHEEKLKRNPHSMVLDEEEEESSDEEEFDFGEVFVKQIIHTIEFVLGAVSNTASYLRLWALSLAHAELSEVFWERVLIQSYESGVGSAAGFVFVFIGFGAWAGATFGVLMVMESLSAFLHALRLHWVEFQNKFYLGDGRQFAPFSYERLMKEEES